MDRAEEHVTHVDVHIQKYVTMGVNNANNNIIYCPHFTLIMIASVAEPNIETKHQTGLSGVSGSWTWNWDMDLTSDEYLMFDVRRERNLITMPQHSHFHQTELSGWR